MLYKENLFTTRQKGNEGGGGEREAEVKSHVFATSSFSAKDFKYIFFVVLVACHLFLYSDAGLLTAIQLTVTYHS